MKLLAQGTIENIAVDVADRSGVIDDLTGIDVRYHVRRRSGDPNFVLQDQAAIVDGMTALCLIDTVNTAFPIGDYQLYVSFDIAPETPRIGPMLFRVVHDLEEGDQSYDQPQD